MLPSFIHTSLPRAVWTQQRTDYLQRVSPFLDAQTNRRKQNIKHPIFDFLFEYYSFRPTRMKRWSPGLGVFLQDTRPSDDFHRDFTHTPTGSFIHPNTFPHKRQRATRWIRDLLANTAQRAPNMGCFGLHEWAMVYRDPDVRHTQLPLRFPHERIAEIVEANTIVCSHYDAFRFFTQPAKPRNKLQPSPEAMPTMEQPGCIHTNMDLYKWSYKLHPFIPSTLIADALDLARKARVIDMRASPYDLSPYDLPAIPIETPEGQRLYRQHQRELIALSQPIRETLIQAYDTLIQHFDSPHATPSPL